MSRFAKGESGQSLVEYVLLLLMVVISTRLIGKFMPAALRQLEKPLKSDFVLIYKYGDKKTCGNDPSDPPPCSGTASLHPRVVDGNNFRLFGRGP